MFRHETYDLSCVQLLFSARVKYPVTHNALFDPPTFNKFMLCFPARLRTVLNTAAIAYPDNLCSLTTQLLFWIILNYPFSKSQPREERVDVLPAATAHL